PDVSGPGAAAAVAAPGSQQQVSVLGLTAGVAYTFAVIPYDEADNHPALTPGAQVTATTRATGPTTTSSTTSTTTSAGSLAATCNSAIDVSVAEANGTGNTVTWTLPAACPTARLQGVQVWRCSSAATSSCRPIANLTAGTAAFTSRSYTDTAGAASDRYLVTGFFGSTPLDGRATSAADADRIPGFSSLQPQGAPAASGWLGMPWWAWIAIGLILLLGIALVLFLALRGRGAPPAPPEGEMPAEGAMEAPAEEGMAEATPTPTAPTAEAHHITCPKCSTEFQVTGMKPLAIQCPNCGVRGVLR
ncbi:MAG: hypothetical protein ABR582_15090, partial [Gemmatimonadaceae bacterium]